MEKFEEYEKLKQQIASGQEPTELEALKARLAKSQLDHAHKEAEKAVIERLLTGSVPAKKDGNTVWDPNNPKDRAEIIRHMREAKGK